ncbi:ADR146Cp [Eremothecium gossypii ATCC 10895]|uniref:V-type proton ATPase subunit C n=1 Tax=Eremothecium gossypii (strain ATCC 10895 / CBS 109.51 / FGSC 9923 / NRRL Y-1056) TaxID=284811 RepID=Q759X7_EREGS|nr:ADR146Cp [Eremothecium gossypii ATCC 10895]AAS52066.1 ADR146Cp [Eremothecium gossypii ATCC 10895]AEY96365.1 FADR146Cp [Eremothecium gossypii FDAG1]
MTSSPAKQLLLLSLPADARPAQHSDMDAQTWLLRELLGGRATVSEFAVPEFKIGSLDALVLQSEELGRVDAQVHAALGKIEEALAALGEAPGPADPPSAFRWDTRRYKLDRPIRDLIAELARECAQLDSDVRAAAAEHAAACSALAAADRHESGDLSVRALHDIVREEHCVLDSEYLTTALIAVPQARRPEFERAYETLAPHVVPGSAAVLASDSEFALYAVHLFRRSAPAFAAACRERGCVPRDFTYSPDAVRALHQERVASAARAQAARAALARLARTARADVRAAALHVLALRVFVESVLRYGLPPHFAARLLAVAPRDATPCRAALRDQFGYLGGNAFSRDKRGRIQRHDAALSEYAALVDTDYEPFVLYSVPL